MKLLGLGDRVPGLALAPMMTLIEKGIKNEFGTQTSLHVRTQYVDVNYEHNQWALRRRILKLAGLESKLTRSAQTVHSHFRRDNTVQAAPPKQKETNTRVEKGQAMPKKLRYVAGLRGGPKTEMKVLRLDLDMGQPHEY